MPGVGVSLGPQPWPPPHTQSHLPQVRKGLRPEGGRGQDRSWGQRKLGSTGYSKLATPLPLCFRSPLHPHYQQRQPLLRPSDPLARDPRPGAESGTLGHSRQGLPQRSRGTPSRRGKSPCGPRKPMALSAPWLGGKHDKGGLFPSMLCLSGHRVHSMSGLLSPSPLVIQLQEGSQEGDPASRGSPH